LYYAGRIYFLSGDIESCLSCFEKISDFMPVLALYGKMSVYNALSDEMRLDETVANFEELYQNGIDVFYENYFPLSILTSI
jgi:hypothetical protein